MRRSFYNQAGIACLTLALVQVLSGCGSQMTSPVVVAPLPTPTPTPAPPPAPTAKPILKGLVTMGPSARTGSVPANNFEELNAHPGVYSAAVIQLYWSQLEPSEGVFDDSAVTSALAKLTAYNAQYPSTPVVGKLRIFAGEGTPQWVVQATGGVTLTDNNGSSLTVGDFWTAQYSDLWLALQAHLAGQFDTSPIIGEVAITLCSSLTGEPFIIPNGAASIAALHQAGYTDAQGMACLGGAAAKYVNWKTTPLDYTFNAFQAMDSGKAVPNTTFPIQVMDAFRASLGTRGVVANHGLQTTLTSNATALYAEFQNLDTLAAAAGMISPLEFQTYSPTVDWPSTIALGLTYHPTEIEVWDTVAAGGPAPLSQAQLAGWAAGLK